MRYKILITYASLYGSTAEIARYIGDELSKVNGLSVVVKAVVDVEQLADYDAVIIGGAIYGGEWTPALNDFVNANREQLQAKTRALFVVAMRMRDDTDDMRQSVLATIDKQRIVLEPVASIGLFAGKLDYSALSPIVRMKIKTKGLPEGDFRDWDKIKEWVDNLVLLFESS